MSRPDEPENSAGGAPPRWAPHPTPTVRISQSRLAVTKLPCACSTPMASRHGFVPGVITRAGLLFPGQRLLRSCSARWPPPPALLVRSDRERRRRTVCDLCCMPTNEGNCRAALGGGGSCLNSPPVLACACSRSLPSAESRIRQRRIIPEDNLRLIVVSSWIVTKHQGRKMI